MLSAAIETVQFGATLNATAMLIAHPNARLPANAAGGRMLINEQTNERMNEPINMMDHNSS